MAAFVSCPCFSSLANFKVTVPINHFRFPTSQRSALCQGWGPRCQLQNEQTGMPFPMKKCAISIALAVGLITVSPTLGWYGDANAANPVFSDLSVLISGTPIKDPEALLRYALPNGHKAIREVQKPLEDISKSLKISGGEALDSVERASYSVKQGKSLIISALAEAKKDHGIELLDKLEVGRLEELEQMVKNRNRDAVAPKQQEILNLFEGKISGYGKD